MWTNIGNLYIVHSSTLCMRFTEGRRRGVESAGAACWMYRDALYAEVVLSDSMCTLGMVDKVRSFSTQARAHRTDGNGSHIDIPPPNRLVESKVSLAHAVNANG